MSFKDSLNKHYAHTQNSVKKYEVGGKVVTKKGATNDAKKGGYFDGRPHSQGGIKAINIDNNQPIEVEGGEVVITKRAVADDTKKEFQGKMMTNKEILSKINESGGGVSFEKGGEVKASDDSLKHGGKLEEDEYYISDEDLNFDIDEKEFADGGLVLGELDERVLKLINNVTLSDNFINYEALKSVFGDQLRTERPLQNLFSDDLIDKYKGKDYEYAINAKGKEYLADKAENLSAAQVTQQIPSSQILSEGELQILNEIKEINDRGESIEKNQKFSNLSLKDSKKLVQGLIDTQYIKNTTNGLKLTDRAEDYLTPSTVEFPYFAPDAVNEYNPQVLTVERRLVENTMVTANFNDKINEKRKLIQITGQLLQDVPVENVLERVEMSLLYDAVQKELDLLANPRLPYITPIFKRQFNENALETLIERGRIEQNNLELPRNSVNKINLLVKYRSFLEYCVENPSSYIANWVVNFFGGWIVYSDAYNNGYAALSDKTNLPVEMSRVGRVEAIPNYFYVPEIVFQGLSRIYDRVGFDIFPISYYATNYDYANWFATTKGEKLGTEGVILPCILNIRRPLDLSFFGIEKVSPVKFFDAVYLQTGLTPEELKVSPAFLSDSTPDLEVWIYIRSNVEMLKILKETKICDGIHMYENNPAVDVNDEAYMTEVWITFYPEQTKVIPLYQFEDFKQGGNEIDRGWFTKSQFLKSGGAI
jgi:DNA-binding PadR family transcriptional regulator